MDASLDSDLLRRWCQVITRSRLNAQREVENLDEPAWEKMRVELANLLEKIPDDIVLHRSVTDPLYWLRQEIAETHDDALRRALLDRLIAAEPTWKNFALRADKLADQTLWDAAIRDELEAARLAGERYWRAGTLMPLSSWDLAARSVQAPGHPREHYERALRWVEARSRAQIADYYDVQILEYRPRKPVIVGLGLYRLGNYANALATLQEQELPMIAKVTSLLMSPCNLVLLTEKTPDNKGLRLTNYLFDPVDLLIRAMCHHHLKHPQDAQACLKQARGILQSKDLPNGPTADQLQFLAEAEALIEGKSRP